MHTVGAHFGTMLGLVGAENIAWQRIDGIYNVNLKNNISLKYLLIFLLYKLLNLE